MAEDKLDVCIKDLGWEDICYVDDAGAFEATKYHHGSRYMLLYTTDDMLSIEEGWDDSRRTVYFGTYESIEQFKTLSEWLMIS